VASGIQGWASQHVVDNHLKKRGDNKKLQKLISDHDKLMGEMAAKMDEGQIVSEDEWKKYLQTESFIHTLTGSNKEKKEARDQLIKLCGLDVKKIETITGPDAYKDILGDLFSGRSSN